MLRRTFIASLASVAIMPHVKLPRVACQRSLVGEEHIWQVWDTNAWDGYKQPLEDWQYSRWFPRKFSTEQVTCGMHGEISTLYCADCKERLGL